MCSRCPFDPPARRRDLHNCFRARLYDRVVDRNRVELHASSWTVRRGGGSIAVKRDFPIPISLFHDSVDFIRDFDPITNSAYCYSEYY